MKNTFLVILMSLLLAFSGCGAKTTTTDKEVESDIKIEETEKEEVADETEEEEIVEEKEEEKKPAEEKGEAPQKPQDDKKEEEQKPQEEKPAKPQGDTRPLSQIMASITSNLGEMPVLGEVELDKENFTFYTFADYVEGAEGYVSEPMIGSIAHSVVLVRLPEGTDVSAFAAKVKANADPRKWICVEAETVEVKTKGNLVLLVMSSKEIANKIVSKF